MLLAYLILASTVSFTAAASHEERGKFACSTDELLQTMNNARNSVDARRFCSSYIQVPIQTRTIVPQKTITVTASTTSTNIATVVVTRGVKSAVQITKTKTVSLPDATTVQVRNTLAPITSTREVSITSTSLTTAKITITTTVTAYVQEQALKSAVSLPKYIASTYLPSKISSACSCISISTSTVLTTAPSITSTISKTKVLSKTTTRTILQSPVTKTIISTFTIPGGPQKTKSTTLTLRSTSTKVITRSFIATKTASSTVVIKKTITIPRTPASKTSIKSSDKSSTSKSSASNSKITNILSIKKQFVSTSRSSTTTNSLATASPRSSTSTRSTSSSSTNKVSKITTISGILEADNLATTQSVSRRTSSSSGTACPSTTSKINTTTSKPTSKITLIGSKTSAIASSLCTSTSTPRTYVKVEMNPWTTDIANFFTTSVSATISCSPESRCLGAPDYETTDANLLICPDVTYEIFFFSRVQNRFLRGCYLTVAFNTIGQGPQLGFQFAAGDRNITVSLSGSCPSSSDISSISLDYVWVIAT